MPKVNSINKLKNSFYNKGFVVLKNFISKKLIDEVEHDVQKLIKKKKLKNKFENIHYLPNKQLSSVHNINNYMPYHKKFLNGTRILKVFYELFGTSDVKFFNSSYFFKPGKNGKQTKAHQDNAYFNLNSRKALTCWVPTVNITKKNSPLYYYLGSNKNGMFPHEPKGNIGASMSISKKYINKIKKKYKKHYILLKKGECIIHNILVVHGSETNGSSIERGAFNFSIKSKKVKKNVISFNDYKKKFKVFLKTKKKNNLGVVPSHGLEPRTY